MRTRIPKKLAADIGYENLEEFGIEEQTYGETYHEVELEKLSAESVATLRALVGDSSERGAKRVLGDIDAWRRVLGGLDSGTCRGVNHFYAAARVLLENAAGHRVYMAGDTEAVCAYYVNEIEYHAAYRGSSGVVPEHVTIELRYRDFGVIHKKTLTFEESDVRGLSAEGALVQAGVQIETAALRATYLHHHARWEVLVDRVGLQLEAVGYGTDDLDGNAKRRDGWWSARTNKIRLDRDAPSRVVVDVFQEDDNESRRDRDAHIEVFFWHDADDERPEIEIPVHPYLACFDLRRHVRLRIHVEYVTEYVYRTNLSDNLILPDKVKSFVELLLSSKSAFQDIVAGKGAGMVVLCAGPSGTGKTLTAEVYAESRSRPLYSVQASQLGTDPDVLEDELLKVFARAARWNAIALIDEADVYIRSRGDDLQQNAIVGVFLRVLEYYQGVLFCTTNRADVVDDAIASRCVARIDYDVPERPARARLWRTLARVAGIALDDALAEELSHIPATGRDIKMLLKLASLAARDAPISKETVDYVRVFKPTTSPGAA